MFNVMLGMSFFFTRDIDFEAALAVALDNDN